MRTLFHKPPGPSAAIDIDWNSAVGGASRNILQNAVIARPLPDNRVVPYSFTLSGVKPLFLPPNDEVRRTIRLSLSVRVPWVKRSFQIVVTLQRRLALARPGANPAKGNPCN